MSTPAERLQEPPRNPAGRYGAVKSRTVSRIPAEPRGTLRNGKISELRLEPGILGIPGQAFCIHCAANHLRRFRVFSVSASGIGR